MKRLLAMLCLVVPLGACQTDSDVGGGPVTLAPNIQALFAEYKKEQMPSAFAVSIDGRSGSYRYCPDSYDVCWTESSQWKAILQCEELSKGVPCKIYAIGDEIVWKVGLIGGESIRATPSVSAEVHFKNDLRKRAEQGDSSAQFGLGLAYQSGWWDFRKNPIKAHKWYVKAAERRHAEAQYKVGFMYEKGIGVPKSNVDAYMWLDLAASQGDKIAAKRRDELAERMPPAEIAKAQKLAREWTKKHAE